MKESNYTSGLYNYLIQDPTGVLFKQYHPTLQNYPGTILPNNPLVIANKDNLNCTYKPQWSGYLCPSKYSILMLESVGQDRFENLIGPLSLTNDQSQLTTELTVFAKNDEKRTGIQQFASIINVMSTYTLSFNSKAPSILQVQLQGAQFSDWALVKIPLKQAKCVTVTRNGQIINPFVITPTGRTEILDIIYRSCGTNMIKASKGYMELFLTGESDCILTVQFMTGAYFRLSIDLDS